MSQKLRRKGQNWLSRGIPNFGGYLVAQKMAALTKIKITFIIYNNIEKTTCNTHS